MTRKRASLVAGLLAFTLLGAGPATSSAAVPGGPETLADSTVVEHWTLPNGLRVSTRHVPQAGVVAISVAYDLGADDDPPGRDGLAQVLSELQFTSPAGDLPERSREDLDSQRDLGWSLSASRRNTLFTEVASRRQFPGVLSQVATRMRGVQVTSEGLRSAIANARQVLEQQVFGPRGTSLFYITGQVARGRTAAAIEQHAAGRDLDRLTVTEVQEHLRRRFSTANAALAIAGNLSGVDTRRLVQNLFGSLPAGQRWARTPTDSLRAGVWIVQFQRSDPPAWAVGIIAPALTDSLHPSFYLSSLLLGSIFNQTWKTPDDPLQVRSFYTLFDEPDLVRLTPPMDSTAVTTETLGGVLQTALDNLYRQVLTKEDYERTSSNCLWILGGPMDAAMLGRVRVEAAPIHSLARCMAGREVLGGEPFWAEYRRRLAALRPGGLQPWAEYYAAPEHQVRVVVLPGK